MSNEKFTAEIIKEEDGYKAGIIEIRWRSPLTGGWGNGYVMIPKDHPWYDKNYDDIDVQVHGGLTFSINIDGEYWVGFDTCHWGDNGENCSREIVIQKTLELLEDAKEAALSKALGR